MRFISTRDSLARAVSSAYAIVHGLAADRGLYVPQYFPAYFPNDLAHKGYCELAREIFGLYLTDFSRVELDALVRAAYGDGAFPRVAAPCLRVGSFALLELFHGPTCAFKDMALAVLPHLLTLSTVKIGRDGENVILVATSGDTGKAAQEGFAAVTGCRVIVFYPADGVSEIQEQQMLTGNAANTAAIAVRGNFDDCQRGVKDILADTAMIKRLSNAQMSFSSANSINFGRLLPQIVYYYYAYGQLLGKGFLKLGQEIDITVPTGNFGNILAAYYGKRMGLPVRRLVCASNENDVLAEAISQGIYNSCRPFYKTASPSMDILVSSNFERFLFEMYERSAPDLSAAFLQFTKTGSLRIAESAKQNWRGLLYGGSVTQEAAACVMREVQEKHNYLLDPHSAVGWGLASSYYDEAEGVPMLLVATASPFKFPGAVLGALGVSCVGLSGQAQLKLLAQRTGASIPPPLAALAGQSLCKRVEIKPSEMKQAVLEMLGIDVYQ